MVAFIESIEDDMSDSIILIESAGSSITRDMFKEKYPYPPIGILSIASFLKIHGYEVHVVDLMIEDYSMDSFRQRLKSLCDAPLAVGISLYTDCYYEGIEIAALAREVFPSTSIVMGGPHATFRPDEVLSNAHVDYVIRREGESAFIELLEHIKYPDAYEIDQIDSVSHRNAEGKTVRNPDRPFITNLDILPFPDYELISSLRDTYSNSFMFVSSRGCPGDCVFCSSRAMSGKRYRFTSAEWIFSLTYEYKKRYNFSHMVFLDDTFTVNRSRANAFCQYLLKYWPGSKPPFWTCKSRVDKINDDICAEIFRAGCRSVHVGVESADEDVLKSIAKHISLEQAFDAIITLRRHGIKVDVSFIVGHHADTFETIEKTILFAKAIRENNIGAAAIGISTPFPGTRLFEKADELGVQISTHNWHKYDLMHPTYHTKDFTENDIKKAMYFYDYESMEGKASVGLTDCDHLEFRDRLQQFAVALSALEDTSVGHTEEAGH